MAEDPKRSEKAPRSEQPPRKSAPRDEQDSEGATESRRSPTSDVAEDPKAAHGSTTRSLSSRGDEPEEQGEGTAKANQAGGRQRERAKRQGRLPPPKLTEEQINSPRRQTLALLTVISLMTILLWVAAKAACNMRTQVTRPRKVTVEQIVRSPKHAAIELQQRWAKGDFAAARDLASATVASQLAQEAEACGTDCVKRRKAASDEIFSTAYVISRDGDLSRVWVRTVGMPEGEQAYVLEVKRPGPGQLYQVVARRPAKPGEKPVREVPPTPAPQALDGGSAHDDAGVSDAGASSPEPTQPAPSQPQP